MMDRSKSKHCLNTPVVRNSGPLSTHTQSRRPAIARAPHFVASRLSRALLHKQASNARPRPQENSIVTAPKAGLECQPIIASTRHPILPRGRMFLFHTLPYPVSHHFFSRTASTSHFVYFLLLCTPHLIPP
jgi:hypothetical protein